MQAKSGIAPEKNYVFDGSGVWRYTVDEKHPFWLELSQKMKSQSMPTTSEEHVKFTNHIKSIEIQTIKVQNYVSGYQLEMMRLLDERVVGGDIPQHDAIRNVIHNAESYGVILDYAPYNVIEKSQEAPIAQPYANPE